jgi:hypothetical protein
VNTLRFRCNKITHEEKAVYSIGNEAIHEHIVEVQFHCVEAEQACKHAASIGQRINFHGYIGLTLPAEEFKQLGYEVGKDYQLTC